ncbi:MAG: ATP-grasp domain-containing protein [Eubacteriales bacterium]|nr:ATP-grasp domain-containing protein [Eubacteriales bacterium]
MKTVLLTAVGSMSAAPVMERYKQMGYRVVGCDLYNRSWNAASMETDAFFQVGLATEGKPYLERIKAAVEEYSIDALIPLTDPEVDALCPLKGEFLEMGCVLCVPDEKVASLCRDKEAMNRLLGKAGICTVVPTFDPYVAEPQAYPVMLKPRRGRSSQGQAIAENAEAFRAALAARTDYIAQPYLSGSVWTVDVARDSFGQVCTAARKELLRNPSGLGMTVQTAPNHPLEEVCKGIAQTIDLVGVVNMEFIEHGCDFYFLEVNPRFSGGVGFSMLAGADFAEMMLRCHEGASMGSLPDFRSVTIVRKNQLVITE